MWTSIILAILTFFLSKEAGATTGQAALAGLAVGAGTYYVATETDWGKSTLGAIDTSINEALGIGGEKEQAKNADGTLMVDAAGNPVYKIATAGTAASSATSGTGVFGTVGKVLADNSSVLTGVAVGATLTSSPWFWPAVAVGAYLILR